MQAEDIIKEDDYLEKAIEAGRESVSSNDDEMGESVETSDEYALEPADSKKASAYNSMPDNVKLGMKIEEMERHHRFLCLIVHSPFLLSLLGGF